MAGPPDARSVAALVADGARRLPRRPGILDPRREARWLLAAAWNVAETHLHAHPDERPPAEVVDRFLRWVIRRAGGEPAEHLVGRCEFWGRSFRVTPDVLVPRPETELLVAAALELPMPPGARVLDVGTGSGCIAVSLAAAGRGWEVAAVDRSAAALGVARSNGRRLGTPRIRWLVGDLATALRGPVELVVANLPYIPTGDLPGLPVEVRRDPVLALDGGVDGLDLVRRLVADLPRVLSPTGRALLEVGDGQADEVAAVAARAGLGLAGLVRDAGGCDRVVVCGR